MISSTLKKRLSVLLTLAAAFLFFPGWAASAAQERGLEIKPAKKGNISTFPRKSINIVLNVNNLEMDGYTLVPEIKLPEGWNLINPETAFSLEAGKKTLRFLTLYVPLGAEAGTYRLSYKLQAEEKPEVWAVYSLGIRVLLHAELGIQQIEGSKMVVAGEDHVTQYMVQNKSNAACQIELELENEPQYPISVDERTFRLTPGETRIVSVKVKTPGDIRFPVKSFHRITARCNDLPDQTVTASSVSTVEVIPSISGVDDYYHRYPLAVKVVRLHDNILGNRTQFALSGSGTLNEEGDRRFALLLQGPGKSQSMLFGNLRETYYARYEDQNKSFHIGDKVYSLTKLTNFGHSGRGFEAQLTSGLFSVRAYYDEVHFMEPKIRQQALQLTYKPAEKNRFSLNYLSTKQKGGPSTQILSVSAQTRPFQNSRINLEYAVGQDDSNERNRGSVLWVETSGNHQVFSYRMNVIKATSQFPGTYRDLYFNSGSLRITPSRRIQLFGSYHDQKRNISDTTSGISSYSKYYQYGTRLSPNKSMQFSLGAVTRERRDLHPTPRYDYIDQSIQFGFNAHAKGFAFSALLDSGLTFNKLTNQKQKLAELNSSLTFRPFSLLTIGADVRWRNQDKEFTGDLTQYTNYSLNASIKLGKTLLYAMYRSSIEREFYDEILNDQALAHQFFQDRSSTAQISLTHQLPNNHSIGVHLRQLESPFLLEKNKNFTAYVEYTIPIGIPVHRKSGLSQLSGKVYFQDEQESGLPGVIVRVNQQVAVTDKTGKFMFHALKPGKYLLTVDRSSLGSGSIPNLKIPLEIELQDDIETIQNIPVTQKCEISGQVNLYKRKNENALSAKLDLIKPGKEEFTLVKGLENVLVEIKKDEDTRRQITSMDGGFYFPELSPGLWEVKVYEQNLPKFHFLKKAKSQVELKPGDNKNLKIEVLPRKRQIKFVDSGDVTVKPKKKKKTSDPAETQVLIPKVKGESSSFLSVAEGGAGDSAEMASLTSSAMSTSTEATEGLSCSKLRAPMMGAVTAGWDATQETARAAGVTPLSRARDVNLSAVSYIHSAPYRKPYILFSTRRPVSGLFAVLYLPVKSPPPRGLYGVTPSFSSTAMGNSSTSACLFTRLYIGCIHSNRQKFLFSEIPRPFSVCQAEKLLDPG